MKKVIVYGVKSIELRRKIEYFLADDYEIIGYSDGHYTYDILDEKTFFPPEEICKQEYDFILLTSGTPSTQAEIRKILSMLGVPPEKIIRPFILHRNNKSKLYPDLIYNIDQRYKGEAGLIFGLSYSREGISETELDPPFFDCSSPGMDLYYNFLVYKYLEKHPLFKTPKTVLLVMPYYYFDYDMSLSQEQYETGRPFALWRLDDWRHYERVPQAPEYVENYHMFGEKLSRFYHLRLQNGSNYDVCSVRDGSRMESSLWFKSYEETEKENREIFTEFYQKLTARGVLLLLLFPRFIQTPLINYQKRLSRQRKNGFTEFLANWKRNLERSRYTTILTFFPGKESCFGILSI